MTRRSALIALARAASTAFFLATSLYCLLSYNAFAYQQFIRPHLISALTDFTVWHGVIYWIVLLVTTATLVTPKSTPPRRVWIFLGSSGAIGVWLLAGQVLPQTENSSRSLVLAVAALLPPIWLAVIDHLAVRVEPIQASDTRRLLIAAVSAAGATWLTYAAAAPFRPRPSGAMVIGARELALGAASSAVSHVMVFIVIVLVAITIGELVEACGWRPRTEYALLVAASTAASAFVVGRLIFAPIAFRGAAAWLVAALVGLVLSLTWSSIARYRYADAHLRSSSFGVASPRGPRGTAMDLWLAPISSSAGRTIPVAGLALVPVVSFVLTSRAAIFDWNFMIQQLIALGVWLLAFGFVHAALWGAGRPRGRGALVVPFVALALFGAEGVAMPRLAGWLNDPRLRTDFVLDGYAAVDPSYKLIRETITSDPGADPDFYSFLRANSTIDPRVPVKPVDVDFVKPLAPAGGFKPHIFFFIIDSLRPDYVSAYNPAVTFTPRLGEFAGEAGTHLFRKAFTRYGGTGLSVPSIWSGGMVLHKEYVTPFAPMNALEKLIAANGYHAFITKDHISEMFTDSPAITWLDANVTEMEHSFCGTMHELESDLRARPAGAPPVFAHTRPLDLHVSKVRSGRAPGGVVPGFSEAYAARVHRIDGCFGQFMDTLKQTGLYDDSIIVVMADHGDSLGEEQRWGHAYTLFPEVMRIPLIVHLPARIDGGVAADLGRVSYSIDVTPTLYALLGYRLSDKGLLFGQPLFDTPDVDRSSRRREPVFMTSSYGAVYAVLSQNGRKLYIADAINEREYAYEVTQDALGVRVGLASDERARFRQVIREQVAALAAEYHFTPGS